MKIKTYHNTDTSECGYFIAELEEPEWTPNMNMWGQDWYPEIDKWCRTTFGLSDLWGEEPVTGWKSMRNKYFFTEEKNLQWFVLRWS